MNFFAGFKKVNWISDVFPPLAVILMEVFSLCAWLIFIGSLPMVTNDRPPLTFWSLLFLLGGAFIASRFLLKRKWPMSWIQITIMGCGLVAIFLVLRVEYAAGFSLFSGQWFATYGNQIISFFTKYPPFVFAIIAALYCCMQNTPGFAAKMFDTLSSNGINIEMISTSEIRITCIIKESKVKEAVRALHKAFETEE